VNPPRNLALGFATIERPQVAQRLIRSARDYLGNIPIYVADQSRDLEAMATFYRANDVHLIRMPFDAGVTKSRNEIAKAIEQDYFVLCDDDFVIGPQTRFDAALRIFEAHPEIGVIGGRLYDFDGASESVRNWELYLEYDPLQRLLISIPIYEFAPRVREIGGLRFYLCDAVLNFAVMRRQMFEKGVAWDEQFKSNGEHEDFFLNLKLNTPFRVAYLPTMIAYHHHPEEYRRYRRGLRDRNDGWRRFLSKWNIEQHLELGLGVKTIDDVSAVTESEAARARFFVNPDLSLRREKHTPGAFAVNLAGEIACVGALNSVGESVDGSDRTGSLLFDRKTGTVMPGPISRLEGGDGSGAANDVNLLELLEKYRLETSSAHEALSYAEGEIYYRYDTIERGNADFLIWYYRKGSSPRPGAKPQRLAVVARWTGSDGVCLVWRSRRTFLDLEPTNHWRPLLLEAPPAPSKLKWMRFDIVTDAGSESEPICTGFVSFDAAPASYHRSALEPKVAEALGLSRLIRDGATPGAAGMFLAELGRRARDRIVTIRQCEGQPGLSGLPLAECAGLEVLYFNEWRNLGRSLVSARLPPHSLPSPAQIVLPAGDLSLPSSRIYGYGRKAGLVALRFRSADAGADG
jgi:GT2 family glycosyltransferase